MKNNPFLKPLEITRETLFKEFQLTLRNRVFRWPLIYVEKRAWQQGKFELVGCWCWGDVNDFRPKGEFAKMDRFDIVPTKQQVRTYMRHLTMQEFFKRYDPKDGEWTYGSTFAITPKFQGTKGLSDQILYFSILCIYKLGYPYATGHAINDLAKGVFRRAINIGELEVDVSDIQVMETSTKPFAGLNLSQTCFLCDIKLTMAKLEEKRQALLQPKPSL
jgi:hypothetical protein